MGLGAGGAIGVTIFITILVAGTLIFCCFPGTPSKGKPSTTRSQKYQDPRHRPFILEPSKKYAQSQKHSRRKGKWMKIPEYSPYEQNGAESKNSKSKISVQECWYGDANAYTNKRTDIENWLEAGLLMPESYTQQTSKSRPLSDVTEESLDGAGTPHVSRYGSAVGLIRDRSKHGKGESGRRSRFTEELKMENEVSVRVPRHVQHREERFKGEIPPPHREHPIAGLLSDIEQPSQVHHKDKAHRQRHAPKLKYVFPASTTYTSTLDSPSPDSSVSQQIPISSADKTSSPSRQANILPSRNSTSTRKNQTSRKILL